MSTASPSGGPRDPNTPGGYCLARCVCGACPQYAAQHAAHLLRCEQEYAGRVAAEGRRIAQAHERRRQDAA